MRRVAAFGVLLVLIAAVVYGRRENTILRLLWPPSDLYSTLAEVPLNVAVRGESALLTFMPKYSGKHAVELHFPGKLTFDAAADTPLVLEVRAVEPRDQWRETTTK